MSIPFLTDDHVNQVDYREVVSWMRNAFQWHADGALQAPARIASKMKTGELVFTVGALGSADPCIGFRAYDLQQLSSPTRSEITAVFNGQDGSLEGLVSGKQLGAVRTGAIGGLAISQLAPADASVLALIGTGLQARTQLRAACAVRDFRDIRVYSRSTASREAFATEMGHQIQIDVTAVAGAEQAVQDADVVVCATTSSQPVLAAEWLKPGVHVNNVGPKFKAHHELPHEVYEQSQILVTDSLDQLSAFGADFLLSGTSIYERIRALSTMLKTNAPDPRQPDTITTFISVGLAGTEVLMARHLLQRTAH